MSEKRNRDKKQTAEAEAPPMAGNIPVYCKGCVLVPTEELKPRPDNPNTHSKKQLGLIELIINRNGWRAPIVVSNLSGFIVKGHGRWMAARKAKWTHVPVEYQDYANDRAEMEDVIADNQLGELSTFDAITLGRMVDSMKEDGDFTASMIGFDSRELDKLINGALGTDGGGRGDRTDDQLDEEFGATRTRMINALMHPSNNKVSNGDWWGLGSNFLHVGSLQENWRKVFAMAEQLEKKLKRNCQVVLNPSPYFLVEVETAIANRHQPEVFKPTIAVMTEVGMAGLALDLFIAGFGMGKIRKEKEVA